MTLELDGEANDGVGKGMSGGLLIVRGAGSADEPAIGNACFYGARGGEAFVRGAAGERLAVRNSGATVVVEGAGDHACEYMTKGTVAILGSTGRNLASGMTGGELFVPREHATRLGPTPLIAHELDAGARERLRAVLGAACRGHRLAARVRVPRRTARPRSSEFVRLAVPVLAARRARNDAVKLGRPAGEAAAVVKLARVEEGTTAADTLAHPARTCVRCHAAVATPFCVACGADLAGASFPLARPSKTPRS